MTLERDIALIDELRSQSSEIDIVEFKRNNSAPEAIGKLCSALSNSARIAEQGCAFLLWGIDDQSHQVVGTSFDPDAEKLGNQVMQLWLANSLSPSPAFNFRTIQHPDGRVVILEIPAAIGAPVSFNSIPYIRIGSATPKLAEHPDRYEKLIEKLRTFSWESGFAKNYVDSNDVLRLLDYPAYFKLTEQNLPDNKEGILEFLESDQLIRRDVGEHWNITNLGAILLANDLDSFDPPLARKSVRFMAYEGKNRAAKVTHRIDGQKGYANGFEGLVGYLNGLLPQNEHIGEAFREEQRLYPPTAIRELVANALIHQDMTISGTGPQIELFEGRLEITNPGAPLMDTDRMIDLPPRSRNETMASLMRRMKICEEQGSGLDKVIVDVELFQLPAPDFQAATDSFRVALYAPRSFADMSVEERVRACYQHAVIKHLSGERMKNNTLCNRFGIKPGNAAQASAVIKVTLERGFIRAADPKHPRAGYVPVWA